MKLFLSYASSDRVKAEEIATFLNSSGFSAFFDRKSLAAGRTYTDQIKLAVESAEFFVFLVSPASLRQSSYTLTELQYWEAKNPNPDGKVLPVVVRPTVLLSRLPPYLRTVAPLYPSGNFAVAVLDAVKQAIQPTSADKTLLEARGIAGDEFHAQRLQAYRLLWETTQTLPRWPKPSDLPYSALAELSRKLRDWYYIGGNGLLLSRAAHHQFSAVQNVLEALLMTKQTGNITGPQYEEIRQACSALRTQLAKDVGSRS